MKITNSTSRVRTSFDPELELPKLHQWFAENPHPSRLTLQMYVKELNSLASRQSRKLLEVHNLCYWFKNARAAYKRAELRLKKSIDPNKSQQQQQTSSETRSTNSYSEVATGWTMPSRSLKLTPSNSSPALSNPLKGLSSQKSSPIASPNSNPNKQTYYPRAQLMTSSSEELSRRRSADDADLSGFRAKECIGGSNNDIADVQKCFKQQLMCGLTDVSRSSSDNGTESPFRAESTSPSSTASLPVLGAASSNRQCLHPKEQQQHQLRQQMATRTNLSNLDLANAVNYLLNTASSSTAAAAAIAAAASSGLPPTGPILPSPPGSAAINLATTLLNSNLMNVGNQMGAADQSAASIAAALNGRQAAAAAAAAAAAMTNPAVLVEPPIRQLFSAFNPSSYQFALGMLDNKVLDSNILNAMAFPTSACAPDPNSRHSSFGHGNIGNHNYHRQHFIRQHNSSTNLNVVGNNSNLSNSAININDGNHNYRFHHHHRHQQLPYHKS